MSIILTALAASQVSYFNALALSIGANIGTTITAVIGATASNATGRQLAGAHFIFNVTTGLITLAFIFGLKVLILSDTARDFFNTLSEVLAALAIGYAIFNLINALMIRPLPYHAPARLVALNESTMPTRCARQAG